MLVTMKVAEQLVPVSRTTLYNDKKAGAFSTEKNAKGRTVVDTAELHRVYGELNTPENESRKTQSDNISNESRQNDAPSTAEISALREQILLLEKTNHREREILESQIEHLKETLAKAQEGHNKVTMLLEHHQKAGAGEMEKSLKALEERLLNQEKAEQARQVREQKILRQNQALKKALQEEKNKGFFKKLFG